MLGNIVKLTMVSNGRYTKLFLHLELKLFLIKQTLMDQLMFNLIYSFKCHPEEGQKWKSDKIIYRT